MEKQSGMRLEVDESLVVPVVQEQIRIAVVREMEKIDDLFPKMVDHVLNQKVCSNGTVSNYSRENKHTFVEITFQNAIQSTAKEAIQEYITDNMDNFKKEFGQHIKKSTDELAQAFVNGIVEASEHAWRFKVDVSLPKNN